jgi:tetratricopeptide (TPR) repeat protein
MRIPSFLIFCLLFAACSTAQQTYSTQNKKAISLFQDAKRAPGESLDPKTGYPNYQEGIRLLDKALEKDPNFVEAHLMAAEFAEYTNQPEVAISHYEKAIAINPYYSPAGGTYFYLGALYFQIGRYDDALKTLDTYVRNPKANPEMVASAQQLIGSADFAKKAMKNPSEFKPINLGPGVNTADPEYFPTITVDGKTLLFTRRIHDDRVPGYREQEDFYISQLSDRNTWMTATAMPPNVNTVNNEGAPTISADGRNLIFVACPDETGTNYGENRNGKGSCDLFITKRLGWSLRPGRRTPAGGYLLFDNP